MIPAEVKAGDPFRYPAEFFNLQREMADQWQRGLFTKGGAAAAPGGLTQGQWCYVKNDSGGDRNQFAALKITSILFSPSDREIEFRTNFAFTVGTTGDDTQPIVVLLEPIKSGKIGRAIIEGMVPCKLQVNSSTDRYAILDGSSVGRLKTDRTLGAEVIYKAGSSGEQWAIVRVGQQVRQTTRYEGQIQGAMTSADSTKTVDNLVALNGVGGDSSLTAHNRFGWDADDNAVVCIEWNQEEGRWQMYQVNGTCPE